VFAEKMGIMDTVLRPHLKVLTKFYRADESKWVAKYEKNKIRKISLELIRQRLNKESEKFRELGNQFFKALEFNQAQQMYTKSISAAIEGPLASLAYFNRFDPI
jgi:hypothetical protein